MELSELLENNTEDDTYYRVRIVYSSLRVITPATFLMLHLMMLCMLVKFNQRFSPELRDKIANNLKSAFANGDSSVENLNLDEGEQENQLQESQRLMQRKQKVYEEMADKQL